MKKYQKQNTKKENYQLEGTGHEFYLVPKVYTDPKQIDFPE